MIAYVDTSVLVTLLVDDEDWRTVTERLWRESDVLTCAEIGYVEARAALAGRQRREALSAAQRRIAKREFELLWDQVRVVVVATTLIHQAAEVAEISGLRGYDAVHLAAALSCGADVLASGDRALLTAARHHGLATAGPS